MDPKTMTQTETQVTDFPQSLSRGGQDLDRSDSPDFIWINIITDSCCMKQENKVKDLSHLFFLDEILDWINRLKIIG